MSLKSGPHPQTPREQQSQLSSHMVWAPFGLAHEEREKQATSPGGLLATGLAMRQEELSSALKAQRGSPAQLPLWAAATQRGKRQLVFPVGSQALYTVGCVFPTSMGQDPLIETTVGPEGTLFGLQKSRQRLSQVRWIWELMPEFAQVREDGLTTYAGLKAPEGNLLSPKQRAFRLASFHLPEREGNLRSPCAVLSGRSAQGSLQGVSLRPPDFFPNRVLNKDIFLKARAGVELPSKLMDFAKFELFPSLVAGSLFATLLVPSNGQGDLLSWLTVSSGITSSLSVFLRSLNVAPWVSGKWMQARSSPSGANAVSLATLRLDSKRILNRADLEQETFSDVERKNAIVMLFFSRMMALAQEIGEERFLHALLRWQTERGLLADTAAEESSLGASTDGLTRFDLALVQTPPETLEWLLSTDQARVRTLVKRQSEVRAQLVELMQRHPLEVMLLLQDSLIAVFNHFDFDFSSSEDLASLVGRNFPRNKKLWQLSINAAEQKTRYPVPQPIKELSVLSIFELFADFEWAAEGVVAPVLPFMANAIRSEARQRSLNPGAFPSSTGSAAGQVGEGDTTPEEEEQRISEYLAAYIGSEFDTQTWKLLGDPKVNPYAHLAENLDTAAARQLLMDETLLGRSNDSWSALLNQEREILRRHQDTMSASLAWVRACAEQSDPTACFGPASPSPATTARRVQAITDTFVESLLLVHTLAKKGGESLAKNAEELPLKVDQFEGLGARLLAHCKGLLGSEAFCGLSVLERYEEIADLCVVPGTSLQDCTVLNDQDYRRQLLSELEIVQQFGYLREVDRGWLEGLRLYLGGVARPG